MALSDRQYQSLVKQLEQKKQKLGDEEYGNFLTRSATAQEQKAPVDNDGLLVDTGQGLLKSAGDLALGVGTLGRKIQGGLSKVASKVTGIKDFGMGKPSVFDTGSAQNTKAKELLKRDTAGEKIGGFVGDVASFALPGGAVTKASKGLNFLGRAAALGASDGLVTTVKQGEFNKESIDSAIIGMAFPVVGKGLNATKNAVLPSGKEAGGKVINSLIKPLLKDFSYGKNPGQAVAEAGIVANNLDDLAVKIRQVRQNTGQEVSELYKKSDAVFDVSDALSPLDNAITEAQKAPKTNAAILKRLQNLKDDLLRVGEDGEATRSLTGLSADATFELKKDVGDLTRWTGNASDDEIVNKALKQTYGALKNQLDSAVPGAKELNEKYANLKSAEIATEYRDKIAARQNLISFSGTQLGTAAAVTSAIVSGGAVLPLLVGAGAAVATEALRSPAAKTRAAAWLASASKEEIQEAFTQAPWLRSALQASLFGEEDNGESLTQ